MVDRLQRNGQLRLLDSVDALTADDEVARYIGRLCCAGGVCHFPESCTVDLDRVWKWLGYSKKESAKRLLTQRYVNGSDFITTSCQVSAGRGGHNREVVMMTTETFRTFSMLAGTRRAADVRGFYARLDVLVQDQLQAQAAELSAAQAEENRILQAQIHQRGRKYAAAVKGEMVYIHGDADSDHTIGSTRNIEKGEASMQHAIPCVDAELLGRVVHHILDKRRVSAKQDFFAVSLAEAKAALELSQLMLDSLIEAPEKLSEALQILKPAIQRLTAASDYTPQTQPSPSPQPISQSAAVADAPLSQHHTHRTDIFSTPKPPMRNWSKTKFTIPGRRIVQYTEEDNCVQPWPSAAKVRDSGLFGTHDGVYSNIRGAMDGQHSAFGYLWREEDAVIEKEVDYREDGRYRQLRLDGSLVTSYTSLAAATKAAGVDYSLARSMFNDAAPFKGYVWVTDVVLEPIQARPRKMRKKSAVVN